MILLRCPGCHKEHQVIAGTAYHQCPKRNNRITTFEQVETEDNQ